MTAGADRPPTIAHVIYRLGVGGLENGLVNLINGYPEPAWRHVVVCLTEDAGFSRRLTRRDVEVVALHKRPGNDPALAFRLWRTFRRLRPDLVHTRNLPGLDAILPAFLAGVPKRVHGEHGRDVFDPDGSRPAYLWLRRFLRPFVHRFVAVSDDLAGWLRTRVGVRADRVLRIANGVDTGRFHPADGPDAARKAALPEGLRDAFVVGWVGRMEPIKDPLNLARAFVALLKADPGLSGWRGRVALALVGDGAERGDVARVLAEGGAADRVWMPGPRDDVPELLRAMDLFVLPSRAEGMSNTILEAMATGLPVVATAVGGNGELVADGVTGRLVPPEDPSALAGAIAAYLEAPDEARRHGAAGRARVQAEYSLKGMIARYAELYETLLHGRRP